MHLGEVWDIRYRGASTREREIQKKKNGTIKQQEKKDKEKEKWKEKV